MNRIVKGADLSYFRKWVEMIQLEQSANNVNFLSQSNTLMLGEKGAIKDINLKLVNISSEKSELYGNVLTVTLERPFSNKNTFTLTKGQN